MSALKKLPLRSRDGICGGAGAARTPTYTSPLLSVAPFSVEYFFANEIIVKIVGKHGTTKGVT